MAGDDISIKDHLSAVFDAKLATVAVQIADMKAQNAADHAVVKAALARIEAQMEAQRERTDARQEKVDAEFDAIKKRIYTWAGGLGVAVVGLLEAVRHVWK